MSSVSTFGVFTTGRLAIYSSSKWLDVIGNNISNINTEGYTRQSVDQTSLYLGGSDKYTSAMDARVGTGALVTKVTQLRDPYMDIRYRNEVSSLASYEAKLNGLSQISNILDEVAYGEDEDGNLGVVELQFNDLISQMQLLVDQGAGEDVYDTNVRTSAESLCNILNSYASRLEELRQNQEDGLATDIGNVNEILLNIRDLSSTIRKASIYGGDALEARDQRNLLIDQLAEYMRIDVKYEMEDLGAGLEVEKLVITLDGDDATDTSTNKTVLVDGVYCAQLAIDHPKQATDEDGNLLYDDGAGNTVTAVTGSDGATHYFDKDGNMLLVDSSDLSILYEDSNGDQTTNKSDAAREYNDYYQVEVQYLRDRYGRMMDVPYALSLGQTLNEEESEGAVDAVYKSLLKISATANYDSNGDGADVFDSEEEAEKALADKTLYPDDDAIVDPDTGEETQAATVEYGYQIVQNQNGKYTITQVTTSADTCETLEEAQASLEALQTLGEYLPETVTKDGVTYKYEYSVVETDKKEVTTTDEDGNETTEFIPIYQIVRSATSYGNTALTDNTLYGSIQSERELLTEQGEFATTEQLEMDKNAGSKRGIPYYQKALDCLANQFASIMNDANRMNAYYDASTFNIDSDIAAGSVFKVTDEDGNETYQQLETETLVSPNGGKYTIFKVDEDCEELYIPAEPEKPVQGEDETEEEYAARLEEYNTAYSEWWTANEDTIKLLQVPEDGIMTETQKSYLLPESFGGKGYGVTTTLTDEQVEQIAANADNYILFSNHGSGDDPTGITASNISIAKSWADGTVRINQSLDPFHTSTDNSNLVHMLYLLQGADHTFTPEANDLSVAEEAEGNLTLSERFPGDSTPHKGSTLMFQGTFQQMFTQYMCGNLAADMSSANTMYNNHYTATDTLYVDRDSVSGVDLNDETMNLMQVQKSLTAAYRLVTVIDEMLDKLINGMAV